MSNIENRFIDENGDFKFVYLSQNGDINAFGVLVERYQGNMINLAYRMTGDYHEACDIVQEAFLSAYKAIRKFRGESLFSTWLCRIVINISKNHIKKIKNYKQKEVRQINEVNSKDGKPMDDLLDPSPSVLEEFERKQIQSEIQLCINSLEDEFREILILRDIQELSYEEISEILRIPNGTVKSRLHRARRILKDRLKTIFGEL